MGLTIPFEVGQVFTNNQGDSAEIVELIRGGKYKKRVAKIKFEDGTITEVTTPKLNTGSWRNPNKPAVYGVGYIGQGKFRSSHKRQASRAYRKWEAMLQRCYDKNFTDFHNYGGRGVSVCEEWYNFQNFAEWFYQRDYPQDNLTLDKDIKCPESLRGELYCPKYCCLVNHTVNTKIMGIAKVGLIKRQGCGNYFIIGEDNKQLYSSKEKVIVDSFLSEVRLTKFMSVYRSLERSNYVEEDTMKAMRDKIVWLSKITIEGRKKLIEYFSN